MQTFDFSDFPNVELIHTDLDGMSGTHYYEKRDGEWIAVNNPNK